jgi:hypothetical protein
MAPILLLAVMSLAVCGFAEQAFATTPVLGSSGPALPDGRVYELVSTLGNVGELYQPASPLGEVSPLVSEHPFEAAQDGDAVSYVGEPPLSGGTGETGSGEGNQWLAVRTPSGWVPQVITPALRNVEFPAYQAFAPNLQSAIFQGGASEPLAPGVAVGCRSLYSRDTAAGTYRALFTSSEAPEGGEATELCGRPLYAGTSEHESDTIFQSEAALTPSAEEATELPPGHEKHTGTGEESGVPCMFGCNLYDAKAGHLQLVNMLEGKAVPNATFGGYPGEEGLPDLSNAISEDGSRVFWTDTQPGADFEHVFAFEDRANNVRVSGAGPAKYWTATPDGHFVLYTEAGELWKFDTHTNTREQLTSEEAGVLGVIGTNQTGEDANYIYFVALNALAGNENAEGETAEIGEPNLYFIHNGVTSFVATLAFEDDEFQASTEARYHGGDWVPDLGFRTTELTPDGRQLLFQSVRSLTGYNNAVPGGSVAEVFIYSADDAGLVCASCDPNGAPPVLAQERAGTTPAETRLPVSHQSYTYMRRWMSEDGNRVFFDSEQPLVAQDKNGVQDVYEWEREGDGTCASEVPARASHGCVFLLSGGNSRGFSFLVDADSAGNNVFIEHEGPLGQAQAPADRTELYDVRVDGGFPEAVLSCLGASCQTGPAAPPSFSTPASVTSSGGGNFSPQPRVNPAPLTRAQRLAKALEACRSKPKRNRARCEREARRRFGPRHLSHARRSQKRGSK